MSQGARRDDPIRKTQEEFWSDAEDIDADDKRNAVDFFTAASPSIWRVHDAYEVRKAIADREEGANIDIPRQSSDEMIRTYNELIALSNSEEEFTKAWVTWAKNKRAFFAQRVDTVYMTELEELGLGQLTRRDMQLTFGDPGRFNIFVNELSFQYLPRIDFPSAEERARRAERFPRPRATRRRGQRQPRGDESRTLTERQRSTAVYRFLDAVVPRYNDPGTTDMPNSQFNEALEFAGDDLADGTTTIEPVLAELFRQLPRIQSDSEYLARLWDPNWLRHQPSEDDLDPIVEYLERYPKTIQEVDDALFGSERRFARHIQWAYDTYLVPAGFRRRQFFSGIPNEQSFPQREDQEGIASTVATPAVCHVCGKQCSGGVRCSQCTKGVYCSVACQKRDWVDGMHRVECWDASSNDTDALSREIVTDLMTRTSKTFPEALGMPLDTVHVETAPYILQGLSQGHTCGAEGTCGAIDAAHAWLSSARVNHVAALLGHGDTDDADMLDELEDMVDEHHMVMPERLGAILNAFDVHGKLTPAQREQVTVFIAEKAFLQRRDGGGTGDILWVGAKFADWFAARKKQFTNWRGTRKERIASLEAYVAELQRNLAWAQNELRKRTWNPFKRRRAKKRAKKAWKRGRPF